MRNVVLEGDCLERMREIPAGSVDMILCDLPYGTTDCAWDAVIPFAALWSAWKRLVKPKSPIVLTSSQPFTTSLIASNFPWYRYNWVFDKQRHANPFLAPYQPLKVHEDVVVFGKESPNYYPRDLSLAYSNAPPKPRQKTENFQVENPKEWVPKFTGYPESIIRLKNTTEKSHPTEKPVALFEFLIRTYSNPGDLVLDNCAGSGTTGIAAKKTGRDFIMIESDPKYVKVLRDRLERGTSGNLLAEFD